jgi:hypothetical protein
MALPDEFSRALDDVITTVTQLGTAFSQLQTPTLGQAKAMRDLTGQIQAVQRVQGQNLQQIRQNPQFQQASQGLLGQGSQVNRLFNQNSNNPATNQAIGQISQQYTQAAKSIQNLIDKLNQASKAQQNLNQAQQQGTKQTQQQNQGYQNYLTQRLNRNNQPTTQVPNVPPPLNVPPTTPNQRGPAPAGFRWNNAGNLVPVAPPTQTPPSTPGGQLNQRPIYGPNGQVVSPGMGRYANQNQPPAQTQPAQPPPPTPPTTPPAPPRPPQPPRYQVVQTGDPFGHNAWQVMDSHDMFNRGAAQQGAWKQIVGKNEPDEVFGPQRGGLQGRIQRQLNSQDFDPNAIPMPGKSINDPVFKGGRAQQASQQQSWAAFRASLGYLGNDFGTGGPQAQGGSGGGRGGGRGGGGGGGNNAAPGSNDPFDNDDLLDEESARQKGLRRSGSRGNGGRGGSFGGGTSRYSPYGSHAFNIGGIRLARPLRIGGPVGQIGQAAYEGMIRHSNINQQTGQIENNTIGQKVGAGIGAAGGAAIAGAALAWGALSSAVTTAGQAAENASHKFTDFGGGMDSLQASSMALANQKDTLNKNKGVQDFQKTKDDLENRFWGGVGQLMDFAHGVGGAIKGVTDPRGQERSKAEEKYNDAYTTVHGMDLRGPQKFDVDRAFRSQGEMEVDIGRQRQQMERNIYQQRRDYTLDVQVQERGFQREQFDMSKQRFRMEEDYTIQRQRFEEDFEGKMQTKQYQYSRYTAARDYGLQQQYAAQDFQRQRGDQQLDYSISRYQQGQDYQISRADRRQDFTTQRADQRQDFTTQRADQSQDYSKNLSRTLRDQRDTLTDMAMSGASGMDFMRFARNNRKQLQDTAQDFQISQQRELRDFGRTQGREGRDYQRGETRAARDFGISQQREALQFGIGQARGVRDFQTQRERAATGFANSEADAKQQRQFQLEERQYERSLQLVDMERQHTRSLQDLDVQTKRLAEDMATARQQMANRGEDMQFQQGFERQGFDISTQRQRRDMKEQIGGMLYQIQVDNPAIMQDVLKQHPEYASYLKQANNARGEGDNATDPNTNRNSGMVAAVVNNPDKKMGYDEKDVQNLQNTARDLQQVYAKQNTPIPGIDPKLGNAAAQLSSDQFMQIMNTPVTQRQALFMQMIGGKAQGREIGGFIDKNKVIMAHGGEFVINPKAPNKNDQAGYAYTALSQMGVGYTRSFDTGGQVPTKKPWDNDPLGNFFFNSPNKSPDPLGDMMKNFFTNPLRINSKLGVFAGGAPGDNGGYGLFKNLIDSFINAKPVDTTKPPIKGIPKNNPNNFTNPEQLTLLWLVEEGINQKLANEYKDKMAKIAKNGLIRPDQIDMKKADPRHDVANAIGKTSTAVGEYKPADRQPITPPQKQKLVSDYGQQTADLIANLLPKDNKAIGGRVLGSPVQVHAGEFIVDPHASDRATQAGYAYMALGQIRGSYATGGPIADPFIYNTHRAYDRNTINRNSGPASEAKGPTKMYGPKIDSSYYGENQLRTGEGYIGAYGGGGGMDYAMQQANQYDQRLSSLYSSPTNYSDLLSQIAGGGSGDFSSYMKNLLPMDNQSAMGGYSGSDYSNNPYGGGDSYGYGMGQPLTGTATGSYIQNSPLPSAGKALPSSAYQNQQNSGPVSYSFNANGQNNFNITGGNLGEAAVKSTVQPIIDIHMESMRKELFDALNRMAGY